MELYADTHNTRQVLLYADLCANQCGGEPGEWLLGSGGEKLDPTPGLQQDLA